MSVRFIAGGPEAYPTSFYAQVALSWHPRVFVYKGILTEDECDELIRLATSRLERSGVSDATTGAGTYLQATHAP
jgi:hypothetical protein